MDEITSLRTILLDKGVRKCFQSLFHVAIEIREPRATLGLLHIMNNFRRGFFVTGVFGNFGDAGINYHL